MRALERIAARREQLLREIAQERVVLGEAARELRSWLSMAAMGAALTRLTAGRPWWLRLLGAAGLALLAARRLGR